MLIFYLYALKNLKSVRITFTCTDFSTCLLKEHIFLISAYGYKDFVYFRLKVLQAFGYLNLSATHSTWERALFYYNRLYVAPVGLLITFYLYKGYTLLPKTV